MAQFQFSDSVPASKYFPPKVLPGTTLPRTRLRKMVVAPPTPYQFLFLEAQAGQGKTTTALQLLEQLDLPAIWYQIGPEDRDPMVFLSGLYKGFCLSLEGFTSPIPQAQLDNGQIQLTDLPQLLRAFSKDLEMHLAPRSRENGMAAVLVLDDVHFLEASEMSLALLDSALEETPQTLMILLLSRSPIPLRSKRVRSGNTLYLGNSELAMSRDEGVDLINLLLHGLPEPTALNTLLQQAGGWPMGLVLASQNFTAGKDGHEWHQETAAGYLERELLATLEPAQRYIVFQLALLDEIPLDLARRIAQDTDMADLLRTLVNRNFFLRFLNDDGTLFGFHHLFLSFLQNKANKILTAKERERVYSLAATYYLEQNRPGKVMEFQLRAQDFQALEQTLEQYGQAMIAKNRHMTLQSLLTALPESILLRSAWFSYFLGKTKQMREPLAALQSFQRARAIFQNSGNSQGELLAAADILYLYIIHSTVLPRAEAIHPDVAHALFAKAGQKLPFFCRLTTSHNIALGYLYFLNNFEKTIYYNEITKELAQQSMLPNMLIAAQTVNGWAYSMSGQLAKAIPIVERNYRLINKEGLSHANRIQLTVLQLDVIHHLGDEYNYLAQRDELYRAVGEQIVSHSSTGPWIVLWHIELAFKNGDYEAVQQNCQQHLDTFLFQPVSHFRSELYGWLALYCAATGQNTEQISSLMAGIQQWFQQGGGSPFYCTKMLLLMGNVHFLLGQHQEALQNFLKAGTVAGQSSIQHLLCRSYLNQALVYDALADHAKMLQALEAGLELLMREPEYSLLSGFCPQTALRVMQLAYDSGIYADFCNTYASEMLGSSLMSKKSIPIITIHILGRLALSLAGKAPRDITQELSPIQRKCLGILLQKNNLAAGQLQLQSELWPDIPETKARQRFDTMMTRLRKTLAEFVSPFDAEDYLLVEKGVVSLQHCRVDAAEFCRKVEQGLQHLHQGAWWQAGNHFTQAQALWKGQPVVELLELDHNGTADHPARCLSAMAEAWSPALLELGRSEQAMDVCKMAWNEDQANQKLTRQLYGLMIASGATAQARRVVDSFAAVSRELGLEEDEVEQLAQEIASFAQCPCHD